jgi:hypothetical protein
MDSSKKLYISLAVLAALGFGLLLQNKSKKQEEKTYSYEAKVADLPKLEISEDTAKAVDRIALVVPKEAKKDGAEGDTGSDPAPGKPDEFVLVKAGEEQWSLEKPGAFKANASNVKSLLDNLSKLKVIEAVSSGTDAYDRWGVTDEKALHVVAKKGSETVLDAYFGDDGSRGQMVRFAGKDGVFATKGYSRFSYARDLKGWRDKTIFKFEDDQVEAVSVKNENGEFSFTKKDDKWTSLFTPAGAKTGTAIERFKDTKVGDLLRAYKALNAADFGDDKQPEAVQLAKPLATVTIQLKEGGTKHELLVGDTGEGGTRYVKTPDSAQIYTISSWAGDWATGGVDKFQEKDESKPDEKNDAKKDEKKPELKKPAPTPAAPKPAATP